jgi:ABC-type transport system involved in multi-copper enzyme maturation permease subunit
MMTAFRLELRRARALVLWLAIITVAYGATIAVFWPLMRDNAALIDEYMTLFPEGFMAAFGMEGSLSDPGVFFNTYLGSWLWPILAALAAVMLATRPVAADLDRGFIELPLSTSLSRMGYLGAAIAAQVVALAVLSFVAVLGFYLAATVVGAPYDLGRMLVVAVLASAFAWAVAGVTSLLAVITLSRSVASGVAVAILLAMYLVNVVAQMQPDLEAFAKLSAMHYFQPTLIIDDGTLPIGEVGLYALVAVIGWSASLLAFRRRDLAA